VPRVLNRRVCSNGDISCYHMIELSSYIQALTTISYSNLSTSVRFFLLRMALSLNACVRGLSCDSGTSLSVSVVHCDDHSVEQVLTVANFLSLFSYSFTISAVISEAATHEGLKPPSHSTKYLVTPLVT